MHISANVRFTLKKIEKGYLGLRGETWVFAKKEPLSLPVLGAFLVKSLVDFWLAVHDDHSAQEINGWIADMAALIAELRVGATDE